VLTGAPVSASAPMVWLGLSPRAHAGAYDDDKEKVSKGERRGLQVGLTCHRENTQAAAQARLAAGWPSLVAGSAMRSGYSIPNGSSVPSPALARSGPARCGPILCRTDGF
jgi:mono/diheme cytochrome c family protein